MNLTGTTRIPASRRRRNWPRSSTATCSTTSPIRTTRPRSCSPKGKQLVSFAVLRDDGTTACGCWIYSGCFNEAGNNMARRDNTDPDDAGVFPKWAWSWPLNRRILYNRASADVDGKPWDPSRKLIEWNGSKWTGYDVPDIAPNAKPDVVGPFIMNAEGTGAAVRART